MPVMKILEDLFTGVRQKTLLTLLRGALSGPDSALKDKARAVVQAALDLPEESTHPLREPLVALRDEYPGLFAGDECNSGWLLFDDPES